MISIEGPVNRVKIVVRRKLRGFSVDRRTRWLFSPDCTDPAQARSTSAGCRTCAILPFVLRLSSSCSSGFLMAGEFKEEYTRSCACVAHGRTWTRRAAGPRRGWKARSGGRTSIQPDACGGRARLTCMLLVVRLDGERIYLSSAPRNLSPYSFRTRFHLCSGFWNGARGPPHRRRPADFNYVLRGRRRGLRRATQTVERDCVHRLQTMRSKGGVMNNF